MTTAGRHQRVWLTGSTGFVGRHILAELVRNGRQVVCLVRNPGEQPTPAGVTVIPGGLFDGEALARCAAGADAAIHLVGIIAERRGGQTFQRIHVEGTRAIVEACLQAGVRRLVHMSALGSRPDAPAEYHRTKHRAEQLVRQSPLDWTIFRPSVIHGPDGEFMRMAARFALGRLPMPMLGPGRALLAPIWVDDLARIFVAALDRPGTTGQSYDLAGPDVMTWNEFYSAVARELRGRDKSIFHLPVWLARLMAGLFRLSPVGGPFNRDQVVMAQEDSTADASVAEAVFGVKPARLVPTLRAYRDELLSACR